MIEKWSKDPSTQVGCVITTLDRRVLSTGYNGMPRGISDNEKEFPKRWDRDEDKYLFWEHAERNAIFNAAYSGINLHGSVFYITLAPCMDCARAIIQVGAHAVVWGQTKTDLYINKGRLDVSKSLELLKEAGVINYGLKTHPRPVV